MKCEKIQFVINKERLIFSSIQGKFKNKELLTFSRKYKNYKKMFFQVIIGR